MLGYGDDVSVAALADLRKKLLSAKGWTAEKAVKLFLQATNGEPEPSPETAAYWRTHPEEFIALCETHSDTLVLLAFGVPVDLISQKLYTQHLVRLPFWQSNGACKTHPEVGVLLLVPGEYVLLQCKRCLFTIKVVP